MVAYEVSTPDDEDEFSTLPEVEDEFFISHLLFWSFPPFCFGILSPLKLVNSDSKPGFDILSFTSISPINIMTTVDMDGRCFGTPWMQRRPIFRELQASSTS